MRLALGMQHENELVKVALNHGFAGFDTARAYGTEGLLSDVPEHCKIVTKVPKGGDVMETFEHFKEATGRTKLHAILMHHAADYDERAVFQLDVLKCGGAISRYGVSVYDPQDIPKLDFDIIQFPLNLFDQRFLPYIENWASSGVETWARSAFLRGVIMSAPTDLPEFFSPLKPKLACLPSDKSARLNMALQFINNSGVDYCILGFKSRTELSDAYRCHSQLQTKEFASLECIDPRVWPR